MSTDHRSNERMWTQKIISSNINANNIQLYKKILKYKFKKLTIDRWYQIRNVYFLFFRQFNSFFQTQPTRNTGMAITTFFHFLLHVTWWVKHSFCHICSMSISDICPTWTRLLQRCVSSFLTSSNVHHIQGVTYVTFSPSSCIWGPSDEKSVWCELWLWWIVLSSTSVYVFGYSNYFF